MNLPLSRAELERRAIENERLLRQCAKAEQSRRGWYDQDEVRQGGLIAFVRYYWRLLEPKAKLVEGWPFYAVCEHLEAVTFGDITRLLINVPPGFMKSMLTDVFWPAWEWGPMGLSHYRYVAFSYSASLTERDNDKFRTLITHPSYQVLYGPLKTRVQIGERTEIVNGVDVRNKTTIKVMNTNAGWKLASSVGGVGTGERGDRVICFPAETAVLTLEGWRRIGEIVKNKTATSIAGYDEKCESVAWQQIVAHEANLASRLVRIVHECGQFRCTPDHPVFVEGRGYVAAGELAPGDALRILREDHSAQTERAAEVLFQAVPICGRARAIAPRQQSTMQAMRKDGLSTSRTPRPHARWPVLQPRMPWRLQQGRKQSRLSHWLGFARMRVLRDGLSAQAWHSRSGAVLFAFLCRTVEVAREWATVEKHELPELRWDLQTKAREASLLQPRVRKPTALEANAGLQQWALHTRRICEGLSAWLEQKLQECDLGNGSLSLSPLCAAVGNASPSHSPYRPHQGEPWDAKSDHSVQVLPWADARQAGLSRPMGNSLVQSVEDGGYADATYNLAVAPFHNYFADGVLVHNCDDLHNVKEGESETIRSETVRWFRESVSSRFNDLDTGAMVVIMQRVHEDDVAGVILALRLDYCHLMIPWEFDPTRCAPNDIGWVDPRYEEDDPERSAGEPAWPERYSENAIARIKNEIGVYGWAGQYNQAPTPRGGGIFKRDWWQLWMPTDGKFPLFDYVIASLDGAFTEDEENDPSALTVWGLFTDPVSGRGGIMLIDAWRKWLEMHGEPMPRNDAETIRIGDDSHVKMRKDLLWKNRVGEDWGLVEWVAYTCRFRHVDKLLIEGKASGITAAQEIQRLHAFDDWAVQLCPVKGDKVARAHSVAPTFSQHKVWVPLYHSPGNVRDWAEMVIDEMALFPKGKYDDLTDSATQAIKYLREMGLAQTDQEAREVELANVRHKPKMKALYPA